MMNNRKIINDLNKKIELLEKDKESKENQIINILDANKELSLHNNHLENRNGILKLANKDLLKDLEKKESLIRELNIKLCRAEGQLNDLDSYIKMTTGMSILDREDNE